MPFTALTLFVPFKPPMTMGPSSVTVTRPENPVAVPPWASNAVTSTENEPPTDRPVGGGSCVNPRRVAGGGGGGGGGDPDVVVPLAMLDRPPNTASTSSVPRNATIWN